MNAQDIVNTVSTRLKLDPAVAEKAVATIFSVLEHESPWRCQRRDLHQDRGRRRPGSQS
ncbi:hypothetical protein C8K44_105253 [Aminobacter sp. AP02]|nr:hypothetical protein C8K44_105253 [Aminobacter sp. AP02]